MKRFPFFFSRSSASSNGDNGSDPYVSKESKKDAKILVGHEVHNDSPSSDERALKPCNRCLNDEDYSRLQLRRSHSFSSTVNCSGTEEENTSFFGDFNKSSPDCCNTLNQGGKNPAHGQAWTPERLSRRKNSDEDAKKMVHEVERFDSPCSRGYHCSSGNSSHSSPISLRLRGTHLTNISSKPAEVLDRYIDGDHQVAQPNLDSVAHSTSIEEKNLLSSSGRPPRFHLVRPSSPATDIENLRSFSFRDASGETYHQSGRNCTKDDLFAPFYTRSHTEHPSHDFAGKFRTSENYDSATTTTIEDVYDYASDGQPSMNLTTVPEVHVFESTSSCRTTGSMEQWGLQEHTHFENEVLDAKNDMLHIEDTDEVLLRKVKKVEEKYSLLHGENPEMQRYRAKCSSLTGLFQVIKNINEDRKSLMLELSAQIKSRLQERLSAKEQFKLSKLELGTRTRRLEKEKNELQLSLEKELDRRSNDWSLKLGKIQSEEQRLRERVRELAEHNVSLQREISSLKENETQLQRSLLNSETQVSDLTTCLEGARRDNDELQQSLSELRRKLHVADEDHNRLQIHIKEKEKEVKELQKVVVRTQRICNEQGKTICGLRQGCKDELYRKTIEEDELSRLQLEQIRLTGVELTLRKEVESCRSEMESLRTYNNYLKGHLQSNGEGNICSVLRLNQELHNRVDCLQTLGLSLLDGFSGFCGELLESIKDKLYDHFQITCNDLGQRAISEYILKCEDLKRGVESLRRNLQMTSSILDEKFSLEACILRQQVSEDSHLKDRMSEDEMEFNMRAEALLSKVLKDELCFKQLELEELQADLASSIRAHDVLESTKLRLQDELSSLSHKIKDMELQIMKKDETINQLQHSIHDTMSELTALQSILQKVSEERDSMWEEVKQLRNSNKFMDVEVNSLRKKIEALDEDILMKEGQMSILRDSMDKPFDQIYKTEVTGLMKEFNLAG